jgi:hypothetical protein
MTMVASFGGGVNSTAMLMGMWERGEKPDLILFADTGGEQPETYQHVEDFSGWCVRHGFPAIVTVREERFTLEEECLSANTLPSIVMGMRSCSDKFKIRPQERYLKSLGIREHTKLIGFDAGEAHRVAVDRPWNRYLLIEWEWHREECIQCIERNGFDAPPKSSCFFCPEMEEWEIIKLGQQHPELLLRALAMEKNATKLYQIKGLARDYSWKQVIEFHRDQQTMLMPPRANHLPCTCYDGVEEKGAR